ANTSTVVALEASTAGHTSRTPRMAASMRSRPRRRACSMFSSTTMLLSTVMPMAKAMPAREMTLMVRPNSNSPREAATVHTGMPMTPIRVPPGRAQEQVHHRRGEGSAEPQVGGHVAHRGLYIAHIVADQHQPQAVGF